MGNSFRYILLLSLTCLLWSCSQSSISDFGKYVKYLSNPKNGLVKEKSVAGISMKVKYLPNDYQVYNDAFKTSESIDQKVFNDIKDNYSNSTTFVLTLGPDEEHKFDITRVDLADYDEYAERIERMNFNFGEFISLEVDGIEIQPTLTQMESLYGLKKTRDIVVVFNKEDIQPNADIKFVFKDKMFNTGINKFKFDKNDIAAIPTLDFGHRIM